MLEIPGTENKEKADKLAEKLRDVLSGVANIARPVKSAQVRISGLDDTATRESVAAAVAKATAVEVEMVKPGAIRPSFGGTGSVIVTCPVSAAKVLTEQGRLLISSIALRLGAQGHAPPQRTGGLLCR